MNPILSEVWRGPLRESVHRGAVAVVQGGSDLLRLGDVDRPVFARSALKPFQAISVLSAGIPGSEAWSAAQLAVMTASHSGDSRHVTAVQELLAAGTLDATQLRCGAHAPLDRDAAADLLRQRAQPDQLHNNCSGKHAGMLLLARHLGADLDSYLDSEHPVQVQNRESVARFAGVEAGGLVHGVDGCGAPAFALPLRQLAVAFANLARPDGLPADLAAAATRLFDAVAAEPHHLAGRGILDTALTRAGQPAVFCKRGAEGVLAIGLRHRRQGIGIALKIEDGEMRGYYPVVPHLLRWLGVPLPGLEEQLSHRQRGVLRNHAGTVVGQLRVAAALQSLPPLPAEDSDAGMRAS